MCSVGSDETPLRIANQLRRSTEGILGALEGVFFISCFLPHNLNLAFFSIREARGKTHLQRIQIRAVGRLNLPVVDGHFALFREDGPATIFGADLPGGVGEPGTQDAHPLLADLGHFGVEGMRGRHRVGAAQLVTHRLERHQARRVL